MKFTCDGCGKRYATADEPVPGRVYKLACKRCGHQIVVRAPAAVVAPAAAEERAPVAAGQAPSGRIAAEASASQPTAPGAVTAGARELAGPATPAGEPAGPREEREPLAAPPTVLEAEPVAASAQGAERAAPSPPPAVDPVTGTPASAAPDEVSSASAAPPAVLDVAATAEAPASAEGVTGAEAPSAAEPGAPEPSTLRAGETPHEPVAVDEPAGADPSRPRRAFELSRMQRDRTGVPAPLLVVGLLLVVALVLAVLLR